MSDIPPTAVVTGGSRGLGRELVLALARTRWVVYTMARRRPALDRLADEAREERLAVVPLVGDVSRPSDAARLARQVGRDDRRLDLLIHNASLLGPRRSLADWSRHEFDRVLAVNVSAPFDLTRRLLGHLADGALVLFISSGVTTTVRTAWGAYEVSKVAMERLAGIYAAELAARAIRVAIIDPGRMRTRMRAAAYPDEDPATLPTPDRVARNILALAARIGPAESGQRFEAGA